MSKTRAFVMATGLLLVAAGLVMMMVPDLLGVPFVIAGVIGCLLPLLGGSNATKRNQDN
jgi:Flp pilus assembly protein TadB